MHEPHAKSSDRQARRKKRIIDTNKFFAPGENNTYIYMQQPRSVNLVDMYMHIYVDSEGKIIGLHALSAHAQPILIDYVSGRCTASLFTSELQAFILSLSRALFPISDDCQE